MSDKTVADIVDGIGVQCYRDNLASAEMLDIIQDKYKNKFILNTEFCFVQRLDGKHNCQVFCLGCIYSFAQSTQLYDFLSVKCLNKYCEKLRENFFTREIRQIINNFFYTLKNQIGGNFQGQTY